MFKLILILPWLIINFQPLNAKVEAPNYNFSVDTLQDFSPGSSIDTIEKKYGKGTVEKSSGGVSTLKFYVAHIRYKFPVLVQASEGKVLDMYARLPQYFLHDVFLQSLVNRLGKQTSYKKTGEQAQYIWLTKDARYVYEGACTITCFPIFYAVEKLDSPVTSILGQMKNTGGKRD
jgi:hypothetical protein